VPDALGDGHHREDGEDDEDADEAGGEADPGERDPGDDQDQALGAWA
jgi:hypothetical protein